MSAIINIEKIPVEIRSLVAVGLESALKRGLLGTAKIDSIQIENSLSGGKTGAAVFVARYGILNTKGGDALEVGSTYIRVLKIAPKEVCELENEGYIKTRETLLDIFSQVEYYHSDEFTDNGKQYGILLYQDVGTVAASDLKGVAKYFINRIIKLETSEEESEKFSRELSLLLQKEVFIGLKKGLYGNLQRKNVILSEYYGDKISAKVKEQLAALKELDPSIPDTNTLLNYFQIQSTYHQVNFIHGDLNPENVLVWENERGFLSCKLIDFGEVIPKKNDNFTPLFWDFSRLLGEVILNFAEEIGVGKDAKVDSILNEFWDVIEAFFKNDSSKLEKADKKIGFISRIYLSTLFDFINEAKSGMKDLRRAEVMQDYFYCQILFFLFYAKFQRENPYKRLFGVKLAVKFYEYANSGEIALQSLIHSLEKFYFEFSSHTVKNKEPQIGPAVGAHSPYMGLSYFEEKDKDYFFGREKFIDELLKAIEEKPIIALAGASGSGKSSVVHAGVFPPLRQKNYLIYKFRPGSSPFSALKTAFLEKDNVGKSEFDLRNTIGNILKQNPTKKLFLLGDQFEELFTLTKDELERRELGAAILDLAKEHKERFRFFLTIRADFLTKLLEDPSFASVIGDSGEHKVYGQRFLLSPMSTEELRSAIEKPLEVAKLKIQEGLTDLILTSISNQTGSLPLLEFCLEELWKRQVDYTLQYNAYKEIGEVKGALATYADQEFEKLDNKEKEELQKIMLQLIQPGQGTEDTRRIAIMEDVVSEDAFINKLADMRLITTGVNEEGKKTLEVVHEALIREWGKLREWINKDREFRVWQEKIRYSVKEWESAGKEEANLLRGNALVISEEWYELRKDNLGIRELEFIEKSVGLRESIKQKEKEAEAKKEKIKKVLSLIGVAIFTFSVELSSFSFLKMKESEWNENKANTYVADTEFKNSEEYFLDFYKLLKAGFASVDRWNDKKSEPEFNQKLYKAIVNYTINLRNKYSGKNKDKILYRVKYSLPFSEFSFSEDGKYFVTNDGVSKFYIRETNTSKVVNTIQLKSGNPYTAYFSKEGTELIAVIKKEEKAKSLYGLGDIFGFEKENSALYTVQLIDIKSGKILKTYLEQIEAFRHIDLSKNKKVFLSLSSDGGKRKPTVWNLESGKEMELPDLGENIRMVQMSRDGKFLAYLNSENLHILNLETKEKIQTFPGSFLNLIGMKFSPDGKILATYMEDSNVHLWDFLTGRERDVISLTEAGIGSVDLSLDGKKMAIGSYSNIVIFDFTSNQIIHQFKTREGWVDRIGFTPDSNVLIGGLNPNPKEVGRYDSNNTRNFEGVLIGEILETNKEGPSVELAKSIELKNSPEKQETQLILKLFFEPDTFLYAEKPYRSDLSLDRIDMRFILVHGCNYIYPQLEIWSSQDKPPVQRREINTLKHACEEVIQELKEIM